MFLPLTLEKWSVRHPSLKLFKKIGVAHVLAVSGLHIGLLYFLLFGISRLIVQWSLIFGKIRIALLLAEGSLSWCFGATSFYSNSPRLPRVEYVLTLWLLFGELGYHLSALFALWVTALLFLVVDWGVVLTVSFQFPFVTVAFLIGVSHSRIFEVHGWSKWLADNLVVTTFVSMDTFPILLNIFGRVSLEVFWLNLIPRSHNGDLFYLSA